MDRLTISFFAETENAFRDYGLVTATTIVAITVMKVRITVQRIHANLQNSGSSLFFYFRFLFYRVTKVVADHRSEFSG